MQEKKTIQNQQPRDYLNLQRYEKHLPSFYNCYYQVNLIKAVDKLPPLEEIMKRTEIISDVRQTKGYRIQQQLSNITLAISHQSDKLNQDISINDYRFTHNMLGRGSHSVVKQAKKSNSPKSYAIKILHFQKIRKKYFIREDNLVKIVNAQINLLNKLKQCKYIVKFYEAIYSVEKEKIFIVQEFCSKGSLFKIMQIAHKIVQGKDKKKIWFTIVQKYFAQTVQAIKFMHDRNIIHRDIKSQNILVNENDDVRLIDFNISQEVNQNDKIKIFVNKFVGTKAYAAPQLLFPQEIKQNQVSGKSLDIWALGITLLEVLERKHPFQSRNMADMRAVILQNEIKINQAYPEQLKQLLKGMLHKQNSKRLSINQIIKDPWIQKGLNNEQNLSQY